MPAIPIPLRKFFYGLRKVPGITQDIGVSITYACLIKTLSQLNSSGPYTSYNQINNLHPDAPSIWTQDISDDDVKMMAKELLDDCLSDAQQETEPAEGAAIGLTTWINCRTVNAEDRGALGCCVMDLVDIYLQQQETPCCKSTSATQTWNNKSFRHHIMSQVLYLFGGDLVLPNVRPNQSPKPANSSPETATQSERYKKTLRVCEGNGVWMERKGVWKERRVHGWREGYVDGEKGGRMGGWEEEWVDGRKSGWMGGRVGGWEEECMDGRKCADGRKSAWMGAPVMSSLNKGSASHGVKCKHHTLTIQDKVELLKKLDSGVSVRSICDLYNIGASTVYDIKKQKGKLLQFFADSESKKKISKRKALKDGGHSQLDKVLIKWFKFRISEGVELSGEMESTLQNPVPSTSAHPDVLAPPSPVLEDMPTSSPTPDTEDSIIFLDETQDSPDDPPL
ncbi:Jerky protein-like 8 [Homarus americanus]|uniref:Jerky protein-like 8 n=1 Tax=Homarus americanus TaxID=6706 RepID=A0A8J5K8M9_HOMAM|nr:Jerky protein-like 8 [Homarus americanus]